MEVKVGIEPTIKNHEPFEIPFLHLTSKHIPKLACTRSSRTRTDIKKFEVSHFTNLIILLLTNQSILNL